MASVFRKTTTRPFPYGAEIFTRKGERFARWKDRHGKTRTAPLTIGQNGLDRITTTAATYTAKYRDGDGIVREIATGCRSKDGALSVLKELTDRAERVRSNILTVAEDRISDHQHTPLADHFADFEHHLRAKECTDTHRDTTLRYLRWISEECRYSRLKDLTRESLERWLSDRTKDGMSARSRNAHRVAIVSFCNWCIKTERLTANPFTGIPRANERADPRRQRRAMTEDELRLLLDATRRRPLIDAMTIRRGPNKGKLLANVSDDRRRELKRLGRERALVYKTYLLTGLRKSELASLTVGQLVLDGPMPYFDLNAADEKNRNGSKIPLRSDLVDDLRQWLADKLEAVRRDAGAADGQSMPMAELPETLPAKTPLFTIPTGLVRILNRDLKLAGIPKRDEHGRTIDVHALRTTFGTLLSAGGVAPRTAQAAMRHSSIDMTMNIYTDPKLLDVQGAIDALPELPLNNQPETERAAMLATGTDDRRLLPLSRTVAPMVAPKSDKGSNSGSTAVKLADEDNDENPLAPVAVRVVPDKRKDPLTTAVNESLMSRVQKTVRTFCRGRDGVGTSRNSPAGSGIAPSSPTILNAPIGLIRHTFLQLQSLAEFTSLG